MEIIRFLSCRFILVVDEAQLWQAQSDIPTRVSGLLQSPSPEIVSHPRVPVRRSWGS